MNNDSKVYKLTPSEMKSIQISKSAKSEYEYSHFFICGNGIVIECQTNCDGNWASLSEGPVNNGYITAVRCNEFIHSCDPTNSVIRYAGDEFRCNPSTWPGNSDESGTGGSGTGLPVLPGGGSGTELPGTGDSGTDGSGTDGSGTGGSGTGGSGTGGSDTDGSDTYRGLRNDFFSETDDIKLL